MSILETFRGLQISRPPTRGAFSMENSNYTGGGTNHGEAIIDGKYIHCEDCRNPYDQNNKDRITLCLADLKRRINFAIQDIESGSYNPRDRMEYLISTRLLRQMGYSINDLLTNHSAVFIHAPSKDLEFSGDIRYGTDYLKMYVQDIHAMEGIDRNIKSIDVCKNCGLKYHLFRIRKLPETSLMIDIDTIIPTEKKLYIDSYHTIEEAQLDANQYITLYVNDTFIIESDDKQPLDAFCITFKPKTIEKFGIYNEKEVENDYPQKCGYNIHPLKYIFGYYNSNTNIVVLLRHNNQLLKFDNKDQALSYILTNTNNIISTIPQYINEIYLLYDGAVIDILRR